MQGEATGVHRRQTFTWRAVAVALLLALLALGPAGTGSAYSAPGVAAMEGVPRFGHVFLIIGENTTYSHLTTTNAPYLMGTLRAQSAWLSNYAAATHWSQANYVALTAG